VAQPRLAGAGRTDLLVLELQFFRPAMAVDADDARHLGWSSPRGMVYGRSSPFQTAAIPERFAMPDDVQRLPELTKHMIAEIDGAIGWITFNKPERRNAVSTDMWEALPKILDEFEANPQVRVIVLKGAGEQAFVSGADISQFEQARNTPEQVAAYERFVENCSDRLRHVGKPTIAMIRGWCVGGGVAITLNTDIRICSDDSRFAIPAAKLGLGYRATGINKLVSIVGPAFAKEIFFTAPPSRRPRRRRWAW
jgi:1,4-dihydroxy-2-naphthoyl-CoA synthase